MDNHTQKFPVVMAIDLIEHVPNPITFLTSIHGLIQENGLLIIDTPNGNSQNINSLGTQWNGFNPYHIFIFSKNNLESLLKTMGYSVEISFSYGNHRVESLTNHQKFKRSTKSLLLQLGIIKHSDFTFKRLINRFVQKNRNNVESLVKNAVEIIDKSSSYFESEDSKNELAKETRGDNIVIIARKN